MWAFIKTTLKTISWLLLAVAMGTGTFAWLMHRQGRQIERMVVPIAHEANVNPKIAAALAEVCSNNEPGYASREHYGLFALTVDDGKAWASAKGAKFDTFDLFDPKLNARIGTWKFSRMAGSWSHEAKPEIWAIAEWRTNHETVVVWARDTHTNELARIDDAKARRFVSEVLRLSKE